MPNTLAYLALVAWPLISLAIFNRWPLERALVWSLLGAYLFLPPPPAAFDFPLLPPLSKDSLPSLTTFAICLYKYRQKAPLMPVSRVARVLVVVFVLSPALTVLNNPEPVVFGRIGLQGLGLKDMIALCILQFMLLLPFLMARQFLASEQGQRELVRALFVGGLIYSIPMLAEVRLSPQINIWVYGYFQHSFEQMIRSGGFRPIVFLYHGLWAAFFAMTATVAAFAMFRAEKTASRRIVYLILGVYLFGVLVLCKSLGSLLFGLLLLPLVVLVPRRLQLTIALAFAVLAMSYPLLKGAHLVPEEAIIAQAAKISQERAGSLQFRLDNEETLLDRAAQKPLFGWGSWGRNHTWDPISGRIETVTDGRWIILIGVYGWAGFLAEFGLLLFPIVFLWRVARHTSITGLSPWLGPMALLLGINVLDMIPNATLTPITWLFAGSLLGHAEYLSGRVDRHRRSVALGWRSEYLSGRVDRHRRSVALGWRSIM